LPYIVFSERLIGTHDRPVGIREQGERQPVLGREPRVGSGIVRRHAEHDGVEVAKVVPGIAETAGLLGAARGVVLGIEVQNDVPAGEIPERHLAAGCVAQRKRWRLRTRLEHRRLLVVRVRGS
jgi:hypothetical protein